MTNSNLRFNANNTDFVVFSTPRQRSKLTRFFPTPIFIHNIPPSHNFRNNIPLTCRYYFYNIRHFRRIRRSISLSVAKIIATSFIASWRDYCNSLLYNIASKGILKLRCIENCLARIITPSPRFFHSIPLLKSLRWVVFNLA